MATLVATEVLGSGSLAESRLGADEIRHTIDRYVKRIGTTAVAGFNGRILATKEITRQDIAFPTLAEASAAAIEIQHRITDLPPVSGVRLSVRIGIHMVENEADARSVAIQIMRLALPEQILCGREIMLDHAHRTGVSVRDLHQTTLADGRDFQVVEILWREERVPASLTATSVLSLSDLGEEEDDAAGDSGGIEARDGFPKLVLPETDLKYRLCVRYLGKAFLLDEKTPFLTLGREHHNDLVINDNRISRQHARIERKDGQYFLTDMSTNGSFVTQEGRQEAFLRKGRLLLEKRGTICFAASNRRNDDDVKRVEFEFL
ncbi:MAG: FHA domain-containing protein [Zoogloeaceae bacterium]|jgi:hypothetical protein|nr:FHA domain-containing protein [Zoogloeaceae bacterium]